MIALVAALAAFAVHPAPSWAHAVVTHASLKNASIPAGAASETTLEFNSAIEAKLAKVTLIDDKGAEQPLTLAPGEHPANVLVVALPALTAGHYALKYKVLAADGHVTESVLRFQVTAPR
jgi:methionine-rich copper-binding protein CopC